MLMAAPPPWTRQKDHCITSTDMFSRTIFEKILKEVLLQDWTHLFCPLPSRNDTLSISKKYSKRNLNPPVVFRLPRELTMWRNEAQETKPKHKHRQWPLLLIDCIRLLCASFIFLFDKMCSHTQTQRETKTRIFLYVAERTHISYWQKIYNMCRRRPDSVLVVMLCLHFLLTPSAVFRS